MFRDAFLAENCLLLSDDVRRLIALREAYDYPKAYMEVSYEQTPYPIAKDRWPRPVDPDKSSVTDDWLDDYHKKLLNSTEPWENLLGTTSVVFWGFYTWSPKISRIRATRHLLGYKSRSATTPEMIADALARMAEALDLGQALAALAPISQLSREPFASKVVATRYPERAGIKDTQLYKGLKGSVWAKDAPFLRLGGVQERRCQDAFRAWCDFLTELANQMNAGIDAGLPWHWRTRDARAMRWRPIDVERAIFKYILLRKSTPLELERLLEAPLLVLA